MRSKLGSHRREHEGDVLSACVRLRGERMRVGSKAGCWRTNGAIVVQQLVA